MPEENQIDEEERKPDNEPDVDKGFAWVVLIGCFFMHMLILGTMKSYGILYTEMVEHFSSGSGNTAWIGSLAWLFLLSLGSVANLCSKRYGFRKVTVIGGVLVGTGYFLSGFVKQMELMYLTFSLCGIGYGLSYVPCATIVNFYFKKRRALANGIMVSSSGIGTLSLSFLYKFLIEKYSLLGTLWIIGAIVSNICVAGCLFRQPPLLRKRLRRNRGFENEIRENRSQSEKELKEERENKIDEKRKRCGCGELDFKFSLLKNPLFTMYVIAFVLAVFGHVNNSVLIPAHIKALGYDQTYVALGVSITGGVEIIARIFFGWFADLKVVKAKYMFTVSMFIGGIFGLITPFFSSFAYVAIYAAGVSAFPASFLALMPIITIEVIGMENLASGFGIIFLGMGFACVISQPICGWLEDYYGNWYPAFILTGSMFLLAGLTVIIEPVIVRLYKKSTSAANDDTFACSETNQNNDAQETNGQSNDNLYQNQNQGEDTNLAFVHDTSNCITAYNSPVLTQDEGTRRACENVSEAREYTSLETLKNDKSNNANQIDISGYTYLSFVHRKDGQSDETFECDFGQAHSTHL